MANPSSPNLSTPPATPGGAVIASLTPDQKSYVDKLPARSVLLYVMSKLNSGLLICDHAPSGSKEAHIQVETVGDYFTNLGYADAMATFIKARIRNEVGDLVP